MKYAIPYIPDRLERIKSLRKSSNYKFDKLSKKKQEELIALDYLASLLLELFLEQENKRKR